MCIRDSSWTNQDGELKRMASIRCYKIDARGGVSQSQQTTSVQQPTVISFSSQLNCSAIIFLISSNIALFSFYQT